MAWHTGAGMGWWMLFGGLLWLVLLAGLIYLAARLLRGPQSAAGEAPGGPLEIAKRRYANGQIGRDEYEQLRRDLAA